MTKTKWIVAGLALFTLNVTALLIANITSTLFTATLIKEKPAHEVSVQDQPIKEVLAATSSLNAAVGINESIDQPSLTITNNDTTAWASCKFFLNKNTCTRNGSDCSDYQFRYIPPTTGTISIAAKESKALILRDFTYVNITQYDRESDQSCQGINNCSGVGTGIGSSSPLPLGGRFDSDTMRVKDIKIDCSGKTYTVSY